MGKHGSSETLLLQRRRNGEHTYDEPKWLKLRRVRILREQKQRLKELRGNADPER